jgi:hypothetical protein
MRDVIQVWGAPWQQRRRRLRHGNVRGCPRVAPALDGGSIRSALQTPRLDRGDTFPARGAVEWQWTLGQIVTAVAAAGMEILHLGEYPEPFWRAGGVSIHPVRGG